MTILRNKISKYKSLSRLRGFNRTIYNWDRDFPIDLKKSKKKIKNTEFRLEFEFTEDELQEFNSDT